MSSDNKAKTRSSNSPRKTANPNLDAEFQKILEDANHFIHNHSLPDLTQLHQTKSQINHCTVIAENVPLSTASHAYRRYLPHLSLPPLGHSIGVDVDSILDQWPMDASPELNNNNNVGIHSTSNDGLQSPLMDGYRRAGVKFALHWEHIHQPTQQLVYDHDILVNHKNTESFILPGDYQPTIFLDLRHAIPEPSKQIVSTENLTDEHRVSYKVSSGTFSSPIDSTASLGQLEESLCANGALKEFTVPKRTIGENFAKTINEFNREDKADLPNDARTVSDGAWNVGGFNLIKEGSRTALFRSLPGSVDGKEIQQQCLDIVHTQALMEEESRIPLLRSLPDSADGQEIQQECIDTVDSRALIEEESRIPLLCSPLASIKEREIAKPAANVSSSPFPDHIDGADSDLDRPETPDTQDFVKPFERVDDPSVQGYFRLPDEEDPVDDFTETSAV